jgi:hypothetical protein
MDAALLYGSGERVLALTVAEAGTSMLSQQDDVDGPHEDIVCRAKTLTMIMQKECCVRKRLMH